MKGDRVLLVTSEDLPDLTPDDRLLLDELLRRGVDARPAVWSDPAVKWEDARLAVLRSTWDYHLRAAAFLEWVDGVSERTVLKNPRTLVRWNAHKGYLRDLEARGIAITPTEWLRAGDRVDGRMRDRGWPDAVVKPAVSAGAFNTKRLRDASEPLVADEEALLQPYLPELGEARETSLVFIAGKLTHAVTRESALERGLEAADLGRLHAAAPDEVAFAERALAAGTVAGESLYARVDLVRSAAYGLLLLELELIEPNLFLPHSPAAVSALADAIG